MLTGNLDRRIKLRQRSSHLLDEMGGQIDEWTDYWTVWANVKPVSDGERFGSGNVKSYATHRFTIRYSQDVANIDPTWQLVFDGRDFEISGIKEIGRRLFLEITATAVGERG